MGDNFEEFCGGEFWNETLLVDNSWPQFTDCFLHTAVVWIPCGFLWLLLPRYVISVKRERTDGFRLTLLNGSKLVICLFLAALHLTQLIKRSEDEDVSLQDKAAYLADALWIASFLLMACMTQYERLNGVQALGVPFFFWLLTSLCNTIPFYHMLKMRDDDDLMFITGIVIYSLQLLSLLLTFFTDDFSKQGYTLAEKPPCPETKCSFPSLLTFFWMTSLIVTGFKRDLREDDLWQLNRTERSDSVVPTFFKLWQEEEDRCRSRASKKGGGWFEKVLHSIKDVAVPTSSKDGGGKEALTERSPLYTPPSVNRGKGKRPSLLRVVCKMFWWDIVVCLIFKVTSDIIFLLSPFFLNLLLDFIVTNEPDREWQGYVIAVGLFLTCSLKGIFFGHSLFGATRVGIRIKAVLVAAIFKKVLTMNNATRNSSTAGKIVNMMSVDAQQIMERMDGIFFGLTTPVQIVVAVVMLYQVVGWSVFVGIGVLAFQVPLNAMLARKQKTYREQNLRFKDERVKLFGEILNAVKVIKLYAWEQSFRDNIWSIRKKELDVMLKMVNLNAVMGLVWDMAPFLVTLTTFAAFVLSDRTNRMTPADAFVSLAYFNILRAPLNTFATMIVITIQSFVSLERINQFLVGEDLDPKSVTHDYSSEHVISVKSGTFAWTRNSKPCLNNINLEVGEGMLVAVVGPVGCGKSSLISAILGEMEKLHGTVSTRGSIAYVPQQAWIQNATVRDNILFGRPYVRSKYTTAIRQCQLERDLQLLPASDMTEIGEKGINLSGGQKQRVSLARALYSENDVFLLDDPLSAVDSHVGKALFKNVLGPGGLLKDKTRILVTHGVHWLPMVDEIIVLQDGKISERGSYETLVASNGPFAQSLKTYLIEVADDPEEDPEMAAIEKEMLEHLDSVSVETSKTSSHDDLSSSFSSGRPRRRKREKESSQSQSLVSSNTSMRIREANKEAGRLVTIETVETGKVKAKVFWQYITAAGLPYLALAFLFYVSFQASSVGSSFWLKAWTSDSALANVSSPDFDEENDYYLLIYGLYGVAQALCLIAFNWLYWRRMVHAAKEMHSKLANRLLRYPMTFFDTTPIGRILNRVSLDVDTVDSTLPMHVRGVLVYSSLVLVTIVVIMTVTPVTGAVLFPVILVYYFCQKSFVPTSRQLKRIESVTRTPLYVLLFETLTGAASVRAYGASARFLDKATQIVDHNQIFFFATHASVRWLQWNLDFLSSLVIFAAALFEVLSASSSSDAGNAGLSVSYALQLSGTLIWMTREATEFETHIVSVERLKEYSELPTEADWIIPSKRPPSGWPEKGEVSFLDYQTRYREGLDLVLKGITFTIAAGEKEVLKTLKRNRMQTHATKGTYRTQTRSKERVERKGPGRSLARSLADCLSVDPLFAACLGTVGVVGRTGAGKTSLTLSLFRLIEAAGGSIVIDGVDISQVGLHDVRSHLTILPQEPVLFSGTLRFNLDPFDEYPDVQLWTALERAHLRGALDSIPEGLNFDCGEEGSNLSVGQRQLVCLARALLRKTSILVLDEATAAVDMETDALIQSTIRTAFNFCTVITIAHRLNTIMDYDRILVMDAGQVKEFASPKELLSDKHSVFYSMAKDAGVV